MAWQHQRDGDLGAAAASTQTSGQGPSAPSSLGSPSFLGSTVATTHQHSPETDTDTAASEQPHVIFTWGYNKRVPAELEEVLNKYDAIVMDTRFNPDAAKKGWSRRELQATFGDRYTHAAGFGNLYVSTLMPCPAKGKASIVTPPSCTCGREEGRAPPLTGSIPCNRPPPCIDRPMLWDPHTCHPSNAGTTVELVRGVQRQSGLRKGCQFWQTSLRV
jgi:hypothetical protein